MSDLDYNVIGLDLSDEMLTVASSKQIKNVMFIKGDMTILNCRIRWIVASALLTQLTI